MYFQIHWTKLKTDPICLVSYCSSCLMSFKFYSPCTVCIRKAVSIFKACLLVFVQALVLNNPVVGREGTFLPLANNRLKILHQWSRI